MTDPWICPRCGTVWAWWVAKCECEPATTTASTTDTQDNDARLARVLDKNGDRLICLLDKRRSGQEAGVDE